MSMHRFLSCLKRLAPVVAVAFLAQDVKAQSVQTGTRLRVVSTDVDVKPIAGKFVRKTADTLWLARNDHESALPVLLNEHTSVEQSDGRRHGAVRGTIGGLVGLVVGSFVASEFTPKGCTGECDSVNTGEIVSAISVPFIFIPAGVFVGVKSARERWKPTSVTSLSSRVAIGSHGIRFNAKIVF